MKYVFAVMLVCSCSLVFAGGVGPEAGMLGHLTLSPSGIDIPDAVTPMTTGSNPAVLANLSKIGWANALELDLGYIDFESGPSVRMDMETAIWSDGKDHFRIMHYGADSGSADLPLVLGPGLPVSFESESLQFSYARDMGDWAWGVSLLPINQTKTTVAGGAISAKVESSFAGRLGAVWNARPDLQLGAFWHHERDTASVMIGQPLSSTPISDRAEYDVDLGTVSASWQPRLGSSLTASYQWGSESGQGLDEQIRIWGISATQYLSPKASITTSYTNDSWGVMGNYYAGRWNLGASFSPESLRRSEDYLGRADVMYFWAACSY